MNYLQIKFCQLEEKNKTDGLDFDEYLTIGLYHCLDWRSYYLTQQNLPDDEQLDEARGKEAFQIRKRWLARDDPGITSKNRFWSHIDVLCVSQTLAKCTMNWGSGRERLTQTIARIGAVKFSEEHGEFIKRQKSGFDRYIVELQQRVDMLKGYDFGSYDGYQHITELQEAIKEAETALEKAQSRGGREAFCQRANAWRRSLDHTGSVFVAK